MRKGRKSLGRTGCKVSGASCVTAQGPGGPQKSEARSQKAADPRSVPLTERELRVHRLQTLGRFRNLHGALSLLRPRGIDERMSSFWLLTSVSRLLVARSDRAIGASNNPLEFNREATAGRRQSAVPDSQRPAPGGSSDNSQIA